MNPTDFWLWDTYIDQILAVEVGAGVRSIYNVNGCPNLLRVTFAENSRLEIIGDAAFMNCPCLTTINLPNHVTVIGSSAFAYCTNLTTINIPSSVTTIYANAFANCSSLTGEIIIPNKVTTIYEDTFYNCSKLTKITISNSVTSIQKQAFTNCTALTEISIPDSVIAIGESAFSHCSSLTEIKLPKNLLIISKYLFNACSKLETVYIPTGLQLIQSGAFSRTSLEKLVYCGTEDQWNAITKLSNDDVEVNLIPTYHNYNWVKTDLITYQGTCDNCGHTTTTNKLPQGESLTNNPTTDASTTNVPSIDEAESKKSNKKVPTEEIDSSKGKAIRIPGCQSSVFVSTGLIFLLSIGFASLLLKKKEL